MITQRFGSKYRGWESKANNQFMGFTHLLSAVCDNLHERKEDLNMIEIGSYMGESTMLFASTGLFNEIHVIEPHKGSEDFNDEHGYDWDFIKKEFETNLRVFDNITHHVDFSHNISDRFENESIDFVYIDADHSYEGVKRDIQLYLPKLKKNGLMAGHDYHEVWPGVVRAVDEIFGEPDVVVWDTSWLKVL
tara:strand:+ start:401 stop:973 length:573 start_codon:yes stop_codon:yes gene_type:complete